MEEKSKFAIIVLAKLFHTVSPKDLSVYPTLKLSQRPISLSLPAWKRRLIRGATPLDTFAFVKVRSDSNLTLNGISSIIAARGIKGEYGCWISYQVRDDHKMNHKKTLSTSLKDYVLRRYTPQSDKPIASLPKKDVAISAHNGGCYV